MNLCNAGEPALFPMSGNRVKKVHDDNKADNTLLDAITKLSNGIIAMEGRLKDTMKEEFSEMKEKIKDLEDDNERRADAILELDERLKNRKLYQSLYSHKYLY